MVLVFLTLELGKYYLGYYVGVDFLTNRMRYEDIFLSSEISSERCNFSSLRNEQRIFGNLVANSMNFSLEDTDKLFEEELTMLILHEVSIPRTES